MESRRKANKQHCCNPKRKEVVVVGDVFDVNTCETLPPVCAGEVQCASPPRTESLVASPEDCAPARNSTSVPLLGVTAKSGVRSRNQRQRSSGRASPSPAISWLSTAGISGDSIIP